MTADRAASRSGPADHQLLASAKAAAALATLEPSGSGQFARLVIGVLTNRQAEPVGYAIVANRLGREPRDQVAYIVEDGHRQQPWSREKPAARAGDWRFRKGRGAPPSSAIRSSKLRFAHPAAPTHSEDRNPSIPGQDS
jgi:hypothetical protein